MTTPATASRWPGGKMVTILRRGVTGQDALGNDIYGTIETVQVAAVLVPLQMALAPRATRGGSFAEEVEGQFIIAAGYTMFLPAGTIISVTDEVIIDGDTWRVSGQPGSYQSPFTGTPGAVQVELLRVTG